MEEWHRSSTTTPPPTTSSSAGLPRLPQVNMDISEYWRVLPRAASTARSTLRASHPRRAAASHQESGAHQGFPKLSEDPKVGSLRRGPHRVHQDGKQGSRRRLRFNYVVATAAAMPSSSSPRCRREARAPWRGSRPLLDQEWTRSSLPRPLPGRRRQARRQRRGEANYGLEDQMRLAVSSWRTSRSPSDVNEDIVLALIDWRRVEEAPRR